MNYTSKHRLWSPKRSWSAAKNVDTNHDIICIEKGGQFILFSFVLKEIGEGSTYGNGHILEYEYDQYDRLIAKKETVDSTTETQYTARYFYNSNGLLARVSDEQHGRVTDYTYDLSDRLIVYQNPSGYLMYGYDNQDRTTKITTKFNGNQSVTNYAYLLANRPGVTTFPIGKIDRTYDSLQREAVHQVYTNANSDRHLRSESVYLDVEGNRTTQLISQYNHYVGTSDSVKDALGGYTSFTYTYDDNGNISSITEKAGSSTRLKTYEYDALNQLIRENDESQGKTYTYTYDNGGNLLEKRTYAYTKGTLGEVLDSVLYTYGDTEWRDLLTAYDGQSITYDGIGNPLTYRNGLQFTWSQGRRLAQATLSDGRVVNYTYNEQGIRIGKSVDGIQTEYFVDDSGRMYGMKQGEETLIFLYDSTGRLEGFRWLTGTTDHGEYYYVYNIQGDVIGIVANDLTLVVEYEYDSWGKVLNVSGSMSTTIGELNPIRYRGYCYDAETGFYSTGTRYYDPDVGRFISPDTIAVLTATPMGLTDKNLYAYCDNDPIVRADNGGQFWHIVAGAAIGGLIGGISSIVGQAVSGQKINWAEVGVSAASGALTGAITAACPGMGAVASGLVHGVIGAGTYAATELVNGRTPTVVGTLAAGVTSGVLAGGAKAISNKLTTTKLYRSVSDVEAKSFSSTGKLSAGAGQMEGKFFATTRANAKIWGSKLGSSNMISIRVPNSALSHSSVTYFQRLDAIGPAYYFSDLAYLNSVLR